MTLQDKILKRKLKKREKQKLKVIQDRNQESEEHEDTVEEEEEVAAAQDTTKKRKGDDEADKVASQEDDDDQEESSKPKKKKKKSKNWNLKKVVVNIWNGTVFIARTCETLPVILIISESKPDQEESAPSEANDEPSTEDAKEGATDNVKRMSILNHSTLKIIFK